MKLLAGLTGGSDNQHEATELLWIEMGLAPDAQITQVLAAAAAVPGITHAYLKGNFSGLSVENFNLQHQDHQMLGRDQLSVRLESEICAHAADGGRG